VTAGQTGAPAGFDIQWMTQADYIALGNQWPDSEQVPNPLASSFCKASLGGEAPDCGVYNLESGQSATIVIGDDHLYDNSCATSPCAGQPLVCNTAYVFRVRAHADSEHDESEFSDTIVCATLPCVGNPCTYTQGFWRTHGPIPVGNNENLWPVTSLALGAVLYTDMELLAILETPARGNGLLILAHQLIAAKLNIANGAPDEAIAVTVGNADALIGGLIVPPIGEGYLPPSQTSAMTETLTEYNEGTIGPGHCQ
jgi:hypothetical protein